MMYEQYAILEFARAKQNSIQKMKIKNPTQSSIIHTGAKENF